MDAHALGFSSSWKMLTRDKGWIKPVLILALLGWIPIFGQIAVLGYGMEWARLTAWGVDATPKQRGVDYGKVLLSGCRAFGLIVVLGLIVAVPAQLLLPGSLGLFVTGMTSGGMGCLLAAIPSPGSALAGVIVGAFTASLLLAALRATLYDSFGAGFRVDRLFQMMSTDSRGYLKVLLTALIGSGILIAYAIVVALLALIGFFVFFLGYVHTAPGASFFSDPLLAAQMFDIGVAPILIAALGFVAASFAASVLGVILLLVLINTVGQWFRRFDVGRWGASGDPLPVVEGGSGDASAPVSPLRPQEGPFADRPADEGSPAVPVAPAPDAQTGPCEGDAGASGSPRPDCEAGAPRGPEDPDAGIGDESDRRVRESSEPDPAVEPAGAQGLDRALDSEAEPFVEPSDVPAAGPDLGPADETDARPTEGGAASMEAPSEAPSDSIPLGPVAGDEGDSDGRFAR